MFRQKHHIRFKQNIISALWRILGMYICNKERETDMTQFIKQKPRCSVLFSTLMKGLNLWTSLFILSMMKRQFICQPTDIVKAIAGRAYTGNFAVAFQFQNQDQFWVPCQKLHGACILDFSEKSQNERVWPFLVCLAMLVPESIFVR